MQTELNEWISSLFSPPCSISMFGTEVECWAVAEFYRSVSIEADTVECDSVRSFNYICGCSDSPGYAGANSDAKKVALVWFPRVGAILSILVRQSCLRCNLNARTSCRIHPFLNR